MSVRFGILGAAGIAPEALVRPVARNRQSQLVAVASRTPERARAFASEHRIGRVHDDMEALLADEEVDAVYIALPNSLHAEWTMKALDAGKHVLVEKPFANNADEAARVAAHAATIDRVCMVGFHHRHHPMYAALREMLPRIGHLQTVETQFHINLPDRENIRYQYDLGGGALMDLGCYEIHLLRWLLELEPEVVSAEYRPAPDERVDERMDAELQFLSVNAKISSSLLEEQESQRAIFKGTEGDIVVDGFVKPHEGNRIHIAAPGVRFDHVATVDTTSYDAQLTRFLSAVQHGQEYPTTPQDSVATMKVIDDIYLAAGLPLR